ncbi:MAG TPA: thioredoxin domain-containing protein [Ignavibacteriaceae bacterium]|nr:thioredoxin domain-containing protein [Ignavibacteriaceae bacterium]
MKIKTENIFTGILVICALIVTILFLRKEFSSNNSKLNISIVENWKELISEDEKANSEYPKVYLIEFFDYECSYCSILDATLDTIQSKYGNKIKIIRYHFPLNIHPLAYRIAIAAECAGTQDVFDSYHKELMANQYKLNSINFTEVARLIGIKDIEKFQKCVNEEETADVISHDVQLAKKFNVNGTPTLIINNKMISGVVDSKEIEEIIKEFL